jgi:SAM-dependent methyltransferase
LLHDRLAAGDLVHAAVDTVAAEFRGFDLEHSDRSTTWSTGPPTAHRRGHPIMETENFYKNGLYLEQNPSWDVEDSPWKALQILKLFERNCIQPRTICEVGCGAGEVLLQLYQQMPAVTTFDGYEISPQAFAMTPSRNRDRINFHLENLLNEDVHFDVVMAIDVMEHIEDCFDFLRKLQAKGTFKVLHIPLDLSVQTVLRGKPIMVARKHVGHIHYFTKETALATLEDMGYTVIDYFYTAGMIELPNKPLRSRLLNWPRRLLHRINSDLAVRVLGGYSIMVLAR